MYQGGGWGTLSPMRTHTGAALLLAVIAVAGCSTSTPAPAATVTATVTEDAHTRAVELMKTAIPDATTAQAEDMMVKACQIIDTKPTTAGIVATQADLVSKGLGTRLEVMTILTAAIAGQCPEHLDALKGL